MNRVVQFLREVRTEFSRVEWPSVTEWLESTRVVLFVTLLFAIYFAVVDKFFLFAIRAFYSYILY